MKEKKIFERMKRGNLTTKPKIETGNKTFIYMLFIKFHMCFFLMENKTKKHGLKIYKTFRAWLVLQWKHKMRGENTTEENQWHYVGSEREK